MRFRELLEYEKLNGLTIIPMDQFLQFGFPKDNTDAEDIDLEGDIEESFIEESLNEAEFGLGAGYRTAGEPEMQDYLNRIRTKTKNKLDPYRMPYIHDKTFTVKIKNQDGQTYDSDELKAAIMKRPKTLLKQNDIRLILRSKDHSKELSKQFPELDFSLIIEDFDIEKLLELTSERN